MEDKKLLAKFMNYGNGRPLTDGLLVKLYNDYESIMLIVEKIQSLGYWFRTQSMNNGNVNSIYLGKTGDIAVLVQSQHIRDTLKFTYFITCVEFVKWYNKQSK